MDDFIIKYIKIGLFLITAFSGPTVNAERIIAIGDIHGNPEALASICLRLGLINVEGEWTEGETHLVLMGDLVGRGDASRQVANFVLNLESQAPKDRIHALLGNHELYLMQGDMRFISGPDKESFGGETMMRMAFVEGDYAAWMARRPTMLRLGNSLFVHAGFGAWLAEMSPELVNAKVTSVIKHYQGAPAPDPSALELVKISGPLLNRELVFEELDRATLEAVVKTLNVERVVVGHKPTDQN